MSTSILMAAGLPFWAARFLSWLGKFPNMSVAAQEIGVMISYGGAEFLNNIGNGFGHDDYLSQHDVDSLKIAEAPIYEYYIAPDGSSVVDFENPEGVWPGFNRYDAVGRMVLFSILALSAKFMKTITMGIIKGVLKAWVIDILMAKRLKPLQELLEDLEGAQMTVNAATDDTSTDNLETNRMLNDANLMRLVQLLTESLATNSSVNEQELLRYMNNNLTGQNVQRR